MSRGGAGCDWLALVIINSMNEQAFEEESACSWVSMQGSCAQEQPSWAGGYVSQASQGHGDQTHNSCSCWRNMGIVHSNIHIDLPQ